jgi:hypothetical protein
MPFFRKVFCKKVSFLFKAIERKSIRSTSKLDLVMLGLADRKLKKILEEK